MLIADTIIAQNAWWNDPNARSVKRHVPVRRDVFDLLRAGLGSGDGRARVLLGPRQVGKSTVLHQLADALLDEQVPARNVVYFDFSDPRLLVAEEPPSVRDVVAAVNLDNSEPVGPRVFLLDEVSSSLRWDRDLKQAVDQGRRGDCFIATDSAAAILRGGGRESGVGRWDEIRIEGLTFTEYLRIASGGRGAEERLRTHPQELGRYLEMGGFPAAAARGTDDFEAVRAQIRDDVERVITRDLGKPRADVAKVLKLFVYLMRDSGAAFNAKKRGDDVEADRRSIAEWVASLEDTQLVVRLDASTRSATAGLRAKPRLYAFDHGLVSALALVPNPLRDPHVRGRVFEALVFRHLRDVARRCGGTLSFVRQDGVDAHEADFMFQREHETILVEVTAAARVRSRKAASARRAGKHAVHERRVVVHGGAETVEHADCSYVSLRDFLMQPDRAVLGAAS